MKRTMTAKLATAAGAAALALGAAACEVEPADDVNTGLEDPTLDDGLNDDPLMDDGLDDDELDGDL